MKYLFFVLCIVANVFFAKAQCLEGNCVDGYGTYYFQKYKMRYQGDFAHYRPHGYGDAKFDDGKQYVGEWQDGIYHGKGTLTMPDGYQMSGNWSYGVFLDWEKLPTQAIPANQQPNPKPVLAAIPKLRDANQLALPQVWAVSVGVAVYHKKVIRPLEYTDKDARRIYDFWQTPAGGALQPDHIRLLTNQEATHENIVAALREQFGKAGENDLVIFYFSGHGLEGSFLPIDYDGRNHQLTHEEVNALFDACPAKFKLCIADACHAGNMQFAMKGAKPAVQIERFYKSLMKAERGKALLMSSQGDEESMESTNLKQGLFSHFLLRGLNGEGDQDRDGIVTVQELYDFVRWGVTDYLERTQFVQTPVLTGSFDPTMPVSVPK